MKPEKKGGRKKRLIAPIRIKLSKMPVSQKLQKSLVRLTGKTVCVYYGLALYIQVIFVYF